MVWLVIALAAVGVVAVALVAVGKVTAELEALPAARVFDLDAAVEHVAERLPASTTAELSYDDVSDVLVAYLDYLERQGVAAPPSQAPVSGPLVAADDDAVAWVLGRLDENTEVRDEQVVEVIDLAWSYLDSIGAVGDEIPPPQP